MEFVKQSVKLVLTLLVTCFLLGHLISDFINPFPITGTLEIISVDANEVEIINDLINVTLEFEFRFENTGQLKLRIVECQSPVHGSVKQYGYYIQAKADEGVLRFNHLIRYVLCGAKSIYDTEIIGSGVLATGTIKLKFTFSIGSFSFRLYNPLLENSENVTFQITELDPFVYETG